MLFRSHLITPASSFFSPSFQPVPDLNIGLHPAPMLYLKSEMHNPSRPRGPSAFDALPLPGPNQSVPHDRPICVTKFPAIHATHIGSGTYTLPSNTRVSRILRHKLPVARVLSRFGGGGQRYAANPGLTPSFRRSLPETGCLSQGLPRGKCCALLLSPNRFNTPVAGLPPCARPTLVPWTLPLKWTRKT